MREFGLLDFAFNADSDRDRCMEIIEERRRNTVYPHVQCTEACKKRGSYMNQIHR